MNAKQILSLAAAALLAACGSSTGTAPGAVTNVSVAAGTAPNTAVVSFTAPTTGDAPTSYTVTTTLGGPTATGTASPITVTGLTTGAATYFSVVASNAAGSSAAVTTGALRFYSVVETFTEPRTAPNDTIFTGTFTYDATNHVVSNLRGSLTQSMMRPMTTVDLGHQLDATPVTLGGVTGLLVTTFALDTVNTFDTAGFDPANGMRVYYGLAAGQPNPKNGGTGNAYAMVFVNTSDPTTALVQAQLDRLAYADCTANGMMGNMCMTGTTAAVYGHTGTMGGQPTSQVVTAR